MKDCEASWSGVLISAPQGRSGKTIASLALCTALRKRGLRVQPFKKGPDYIDPSWLTEAAGRGCHNLDHFLMPEEIIQSSFQRACCGADIVVVEGAMGLFDGPESTGWGSTAHLARILNLPVILVVDCTRMTGSIAAMVSGYQNFRADTHIAAVILNNVSGPRHERKLKMAVEEHCRIPVVGSIPRDADLNMTQRHLGHIPFPESNASASIIEKISSIVEPRLDTDMIITIAGNPQTCQMDMPRDTPANTPKARIGVIKDRVFNFYYPENLAQLERQGAELIFINSLHDKLPVVDGLIIGGGFPELFLDELEANRELKADIAREVENGLPVYAECAGLMYLCKAIHWQGQRSEMVGAIQAEVAFTEQPQGHGYVEAEVISHNPLFPVGSIIRGHEFHHSKLIDRNNLQFAYHLRRGNGAGDGLDGITYKNVFATYTHLHALGTPQWAQAFVKLTLQYSKNQPLVSS